MLIFVFYCDCYLEFFLSWLESKVLGLFFLKKEVCWSDLIDLFLKLFKKYGKIFIRCLLGCFYVCSGFN